MIRHISIFYLKEETTEAQAESVLELLKSVETRLEDVAAYHVGKDCMQRPPKGLPNLPKFGQLVQVIDFKTRQAAESYPGHPAHLATVEQAGPYIEKVAGIDFEI